ncbi:MAG: zinc-binding dehydrogenase, partial [Steroidobacteraceae bacterium]
GPLGCGVQTGAGAVMNVMRPAAGTSLAIFGGGGVGLSALMAASLAGCAPIIVIEPNAARRELALELGAAHVIDPAASPDIVDTLRSLSHGGVHFAFDTCGIPAVIGQAIESLRTRGKMVLATTNEMEAVLSTSLIGVIARGISICGVHMGDSVPQSFIPSLVDLIVEGRMPVERLVKYYPLEDVNQALEDQEHGRVIKPILRIA